MTQERPHVRIEKKQYFDRNIWDMSIDITYFVLDVLQVVISRSTYYISFERMCLTANSEESDEMPHYATFHQGLHCLLKRTRSSEKEIQYIWKL